MNSTVYWTTRMLTSRCFTLDTSLKCLVNLTTFVKYFNSFSRFVTWKEVWEKLAGAICFTSFVRSAENCNQLEQFVLPEEKNTCELFLEGNFVSRLCVSRQLMSFENEWLLFLVKLLFQLNSIKFQLITEIFISGLSCLVDCMLEWEKSKQVLLHFVEISFVFCVDKTICRPRNCMKRNET